jgi:hypothetical protein
MTMQAAILAAPASIAQRPLAIADAPRPGS